jgi:FkbM family methyltransferase
VNYLERRRRLFERHKIDVVLDVGANTGQYAQSLRRDVGYAGRIISFEPLVDAFRDLQRNSATDPLWDPINIALGDSEGVKVINISKNLYSSSFLGVLDRAVQVEPSIAYVGTQETPVRRLDSLLGELTSPSNSIFLKIDAQGYEIPILNGVLKEIDRLSLIQLETSLMQVYVNEPLIGDVVKFLDYLGYRVVGVEPGWEHPETCELLQVDLIFGSK